MSNTYRFPERGHVYRHCVMCGRPFRVCNSQLARRGARFCTVGVTTQPCARLAKRLPVTGSDSSYIERHKRQRAPWRSLEVFGVGIRRVVDARIGFSCVVPARTRAGERASPQPCQNSRWQRFRQIYLICLSW